jgi:hypothetical protein
MKYPTPEKEIKRREAVIRKAQINEGIDPASGLKPASAPFMWEGAQFEKNSNYLPLVEGQLIQTTGAKLRAYSTPGHAADHVVLLLEEEGAVFSGDHVLGWGTSWVEDLSLYVRSLHRILALNPTRLYPGHGPMVENAIEHVTKYIEHRAAREKQVLNTVLQNAPFSETLENGITSEQIAEILYPDTPKYSLDRAVENVLKILIKLRDDGLLVSFNKGPTIAVEDLQQDQNAVAGKAEPKVAILEHQKVWFGRPSAQL